MQQFLSNLSHRARMVFAVGVLVIAGGGAVATWWLTHPSYGVLFRELKETDAAEITTALGQMQVPYRLTDAGHSIMVPEAQVYDTRMKLVSQGVPKGGSVGFELFKDSDYGVTEFAQRVNFQRALQGELERTITSMDEVISARVHLTIRRQELFSHDDESSKASVTLTLKPEKHLDARQVVGIQRLVASAVEGLASDAVVVLNGNGSVLSAHGADAAGLAVGDRLDDQARLELQMRQKVGALLQRALLTEDFTVSVDVRLNYDHVKQVREQLIGQGKDGNGLLVREKTGMAGRAADESDPDHAKAGTSSSDREVEYAHGREQEEVVQTPGRIERISVGVVVPESMPQGQLIKLSEVISAGLGLDPSRGDKVDIASIAPPIPAVVDKGHTSNAATASATEIASSDTHQGDAVTDGAEGFEHPHYWIYATTGAGLLLCLTLWMAFSPKEAPRRLSAPERDEALQRLRQWIGAAEVER